MRPGFQFSALCGAEAALPRWALLAGPALAVAFQLIGGSVAAAAPPSDLLRIGGTGMALATMHRTLRAEQRRLKALAFAGIAPTVAALERRRYRPSRTVCIAWRTAQPRALVVNFLAFLRGGTHRQSWLNSVTFLWPDGICHGCRTQP